MRMEYKDENWAFNSDVTKYKLTYQEKSTFLPFNSLNEFVNGIFHLHTLKPCAIGIYGLFRIIHDVPQVYCFALNKVQLILLVVVLQHLQSLHKDRANSIPLLHAYFQAGWKDLLTWDGWSLNAKDY